MKLSQSDPDIRTIVDRIALGDIILQPEFQRQEVWSITKKKRLIDTILREWSIPPIHLVETPDNRLEVLDGQQRLTALRDFVDDKFSIDGNITPFDPVVRPLHGKFYSQLDPATRRRFDRYPLRFYRLSDYQPAEPSELFYRLNQPTMLTAGEQRNALFGPPRAQLKSLVSLFENEGNSKSTIGFSNTRLAYDDVIARLLYFLEARDLSVKGTETRISDRFRQGNPFSSDIEERATRSIRFFSISRRKVEPYRFNKASIFSWLLFYSRFEKEFDQSFMQATAAARIEPHAYASTHFIRDAIALFDDRSSLRVTDVSSVIYRDVCLWYLYLRLTSYALPTQIPSHILTHIQAVLVERDDSSFEYAVSSFVPVELWSRTL